MEKWEKDKRAEKPFKSDHTGGQDSLPQMKETGKEYLFCCLLNTDP